VTIAILTLLALAYGVLRCPVAAAEATEASPAGKDGWKRIAPGQGTGCAAGTPYSFFHRAGTAPGKLLIYFQGGGACWNWVSCSGMFDPSVEADELYDYEGIFDRENPANPFREFEIVFIPYCTGDVHVGDVVRT